jgi:hypothetical protein
VVTACVGPRPSAWDNVVFWCGVVWCVVWCAYIVLCLQEAEKAGEEGNVDDSFKLMEEVEALKVKKAAAQARLVLSSAVGGGGGGGGGSGISDEEARRLGANPSQKLRVCDVCGALLSIHDSDQWVPAPRALPDSLPDSLLPHAHPVVCEAAPLPTPPPLIPFSSTLPLALALALAGAWQTTLGAKATLGSSRPVASWKSLPRTGARACLLCLCLAGAVLGTGTGLGT